MAAATPPTPPSASDDSVAALEARERELLQQLQVTRSSLQAAKSAGIGEVDGAGAGADGSGKGKKSAAEVAKEVDFVNYFCTYGYLYHQREMLEDDIRMSSYFRAVMQNKENFEGKTVLDVGTGTGILAIWAAKAGARKVYAVEMTEMAKHAQKLVDANGLGDVVQITRGAVEELDLPEKVDIIISEWMGYFLVRESMLDTVLKARDRWLKPGGSLYPSHTSIVIGAVPCNQSLLQQSEYIRSCQEWSEFVDKTRDDYLVDMGVLTESWNKEHNEYFMEAASYVNAPPDVLVSEPCVIHRMDLNTISLEESKRVNVEFELKTVQPTAGAGILGWFDVEFRGSAENPTKNLVTLSTGPEVGETHWGQQQFPLYPPLALQTGDTVKGNVKVLRRADNHRMITVEFNYTQHRAGAPVGAEAFGRFNVD